MPRNFSQCWKWECEAVCFNGVGSWGEPDTVSPPNPEVSVQVCEKGGTAKFPMEEKSSTSLSSSSLPVLRRPGPAGRQILSWQKHSQLLTDRSSKTSLGNTLEQKAIWPHESDQRNTGRLSAFIWMTRYSHLGTNYNRLEIQLSGDEDPGSIFNTTENEESRLIYFWCDNNHELIIIGAQWLIHGDHYNHFLFVCVWNFP